MIKDFLRLGLGVSYLIIAIIALQTVSICLFLIFLHRGMLTVLERGLLELDNKIAGAIQSLVSGEIDLPDPINPLQQIIMNMIQEKMRLPGTKSQENNIPIKDIKGKFKGS